MGVKLVLLDQVGPVKLVLLDQVGPVKLVLLYQQRENFRKIEQDILGLMVE
jgi:hypothetical protein